MKIILTENIPSLGTPGTIVEVAKGYARNFLIPKGKALEATPGNLAAFIPPTVGLSQMLRLLAGDLPLSTGQPSRWAYEADQGRYLLEWRYPDGTVKERLWLEGRDFQPVKEEWRGPDGKIRFTGEFTDFGQVAPGLPGKIILKTLQPEAELRLVYKEMTLNPPLKDSDLAVPRPPGISEVPLK